MPISLAKAQDVLKVYREHNFNASQSLQASGYSEKTSKKASKQILNSAIKKVAKEQLKSLVVSDNPMSTLLGIVGISKDELLGEYIKLIAQDKDLSTKLKAMLPLLAEHGITWNEEKTDVQVPILNVTVSKNSQVDNNTDILPIEG